VLHVATDYGEISETFVAEAILAAEEAGWEAWVAAVRVRNRDRFPHPPADRVITPPTLSLVRRVRDRLLARSPQQRFAESVIGRVRVAEPSVLHAHFGWAALYGLPIARFLDIPLVCTFHASDVTIFPARPSSESSISPTYAALFADLSIALAVSEFTAQALRGLGWRGPTEVVPAGVRLEKFPLRSRVPPPEPARLLFIGRLVPRKGLDVLLESVAELRRRRPTLTLDVIGDGDRRSDYQNLAQRLGLAGSVRFRGIRGSSEIASALQEAHVMVMPSRELPSGEAEGSPVVLKEALAVGVPVVATRTGGTEEVVPPDFRDELVPGDDAHALAERIDAVLDDAAAWPERARIGREWVAAQFDWQRLGRRTAAIYEHVVSAAA
jgi:glycosyltransferase involved in cell wall biosynthesis